MLVDMMSGALITRMPYAQEYRRFMRRMTKAEIALVKATLHQKINGTEIKTAGWMPGKVWTGTPFEPIYEKAARQSWTAAARCFGLMVWEVFMERPEKWTSGRFEKDGVPIGSRTYFQVP